MKTSLQLADLEKRNKELDAREAFIDAKQKELDDAPISLKVYEARISASKHALEELNEKIQKSEEEYRVKSNRTTRTFELQAQRQTMKLKNIETDIETRKNTLNDLELAERGTKERIKSLQQEEKQQQAYLISQEKEVERAIQQANDRLLELRDICGDLEDTIRSLKTEKISLERAIDDLEHLRQETENAYEMSTANIEKQENKLKLQLDNLVNMVAAKGKEYKQVSEEIDGKMSQLREKEESLLTKQRKVREEKHDLDNEKRRFDSKKSLYEV